MANINAIISAAIATLLVCAAHGAKPKWHQLSDYDFKQYIADFGKVYKDDSESKQREEIFLTKLEIARSHNADPTKSWKRGINHLSDRTPKELSAMKGLNKALLYTQHAQRTSTQQASQSKAPLPDKVDWREVSGALTAVKNQGECGSCWTFASTETLESQHFLKTGLTEDLSEQFILDCTPNPDQCGGTGGCMGGTAELAYARIKELGGIPSEYTYPYISGMGANETCKGTFPLKPQSPHSGAISAAAMVSGYTNVESNNFDAVMAAVANVGPLAISVDAGDWHDYESGIFTGGNMTNPDLDHLVQLVGYSGSGETGYWIVRNSWTPDWGDKGFIYLSQTQSCGEDITPLDGNGCANGPKTVKVCGQNGMLFDAIYPNVVSPTNVAVE